MTGRCEHCRWFSYRGAFNGRHECRRYPPQTHDLMKPLWPSPNTDHFCGEYTPTEDNA